MSGLVDEVNENIQVKNDQEKYDVKLGIREWKRYLEYKDSGVEWIGEIPKKWNIKPLKQLTEHISRGNGPDYVDQSSIKVINQACIHWDRLNLENVKYQRETNVSGWKGLLQKGDLLINSTGTGTLGRASIFDQSGIFIVDSHVTIVRSIKNDILTNYLFYLIQTPTYQGFIYSALVSGSTNQIELSREGLRATSIIVPFLSEQNYIITFLDRETSKIDTLIEKKQRLIELLEEKRSALISHAVTKGLDPDVKLKNSGVEWIGEIPDHWITNKLKYISNVISKGTTPTTIGKEILSAGEIRYLKAENITQNQVSMFPEFYIDEETNDALRRSQLKENDILFVIAGATIGKVAILEEKYLPANTNQAVCFVRLKKVENQKFIWYWLQSRIIRELIWLEAVQSAQPNLSMEKIGDFNVLYPPLFEQRHIANFLDRETEKIDTFINKISAQIEKLKEYRTALISAAVTGKIDVREEVA